MHRDMRKIRYYPRLCVGRGYARGRWLVGFKTSNRTGTPGPIRNWHTVSQYTFFVFRTDQTTVRPDSATWRRLAINSSACASVRSICPWLLDW